MTLGILLVGEAPSKPLDGRSGGWLASLVGTTWRELEERVVVRNLFGTHPGSAFPHEQARRAAVRMLSWASSEAGAIVMLGRNVARAFGLTADDPILTWRSLGAHEAIVVPYPTLSRWNPEENRERARAAVREILERSDRGGPDPERRPFVIHRWKRRVRSVEASP